ncbi:MAG: hypothetical protein K2J08_00320 [Ruminococcus sp.]|nr:hypothetical protein [Ruminococcus sp.]
MNIIFIAELIITIIASLIFIKEVKPVIKVAETEESDTQQEETDKQQKKTVKPPPSRVEFFADFFTILMIVIGIFDITHLADFGQFQGVFITMGVFLAVEKAINFIRCRKKSRTLKFFAKALLVVFIAELTIFQFSSYRMFFGNYVQKELDIPNATKVTKSTEDSSEISEVYGQDEITVEGKDTLSLVFEDINMKVGTVKIDITDASEEIRNKLFTNIDATDDTYSHYYRDSIIRMESYIDNANSQYTTVLLSGNTGKMKFNFSQTYGDRFFKISKIELNIPIPFDVSVLRMILLSVIPTLAYAIVFSAFLKKSYAGNKLFCNLSTAFIAVIAVVITISAIVVKIPEKDKKDYFKQETGNQLSEEVVLAFEEGQVSLLHEPTPELYNIENPYDRGLRESTDINDSFKDIWDHVLYNEKLYSYYGIAPVILLFLPYHKITGYFFPTDIAVMIFSIIGIAFLAMTYSAIIKRWFSRITSGCYLAGLIIVISTCGIWYSIGRTLFYEIAMSSGFAFITLGSYFLISSNVISNGKTSLIKTFFASLFFATAVLCRPTLAVYSVCACVYYLIGFKKSAEVLDSTATDGIKAVKARRIIYTVCALLPFVVLGSVQMWYNYVRFESPFDFGIKYSLTINDFVHAQYHTLFVLITMFAYIFSTPQFKASYPYVSTNFDYFDANGYFFKDVGTTSGILFLALPVFSYIFTGKALKKLPNRKEKLKYTTIVGLPCVIMPLVIMFSIWESGYAVRYTSDFSWQIIIGALAVAFFLYINSENEFIRKLFRGFMAFSMVWALVTNIPQAFNFMFNSHEYYPNVIVNFRQMIEFWN